MPPSSAPSLSNSSTNYNNSRGKIICGVVSKLVILSVMIYFLVDPFLPNCVVCPYVGEQKMSQPLRVVPGGLGMTCGELESSVAICRAHAPLKEKFDLPAYCGCKKGPPPNECNFECPLPVDSETESPNPSSLVDGHLTIPVVAPFKISDQKDNPSHFDEIVLDDSTSSLPSESPSLNDGDKERLKDSLPPDGPFEADKVSCSDASIILPFITDQQFCEEVQSVCCSAITTMGESFQSGIPDACIMCEHGFEVDEEKPLPSDDNGQTCGDISRFYEHASNELFCREAISSLRDHCCVEIDPTKTTQLDLASSATFKGLNKLLLLLCAIAAVVFGGLESGFTLA